VWRRSGGCDRPSTATYAVICLSTCSIIRERLDRVSTKVSRNIFAVPATDAPAPSFDARFGPIAGPPPNECRFTPSATLPGHLRAGGGAVHSINNGVRAKDGKKLSLVYRTAINAPRQKTQAIVKQACQKAGIEVELKSITASVYFSSDLGNPDTYTKFYCDLQMYTATMPQPDPKLFINQFVSWEIASKENKWQGRNITRWHSEEYDKAFRAAEGELDPVKRAALFIRMNDLVCDNRAVIPVVNRPKVQAVSNKLHTPGSGWDNDLWNLKDWYRDA
jgi:peptide/nickel transport system substrate-binding protein